MILRRPLALLVLAAAVMAPGCIIKVTDPYDPVGTDATVQGNWTINGRAADSAGCNALGVTTVRLAFYNEGSALYLDTLEAPCSQGEIDTRPRGVLRAGVYEVAWEAFNGTSRVAMGGRHTIRAEVGGHVVVPPVDFVASMMGFMPLGSDATVETSWTLNGRAPTASSCAAVDFDTLRIVLYPADDVDFENGIPVISGNCEDGEIDTRPDSVLRAGTYLWSLEAVDKFGEIIGSLFATEPVTVVPGHVMFPALDLDFPTTLGISVSFESPATGLPSTCAEAGVSTMGWRLFRSGEVTPIIQQNSMPCREYISFDSATHAAMGFGSGTFRFEFSGNGAGGTPMWQTDNDDCPAVLVGNGELVSASCTASLMR